LGSTVSRFDDAALKTSIVLQLRQGPMTQADLAEALRLDEHALRFALKRLSKARVISPTWLEGEKAWRVTKAGRQPAPATDEPQVPDAAEGVTDVEAPRHKSEAPLHKAVADDDPLDPEPDDDELADEDLEGLEDDEDDDEAQPPPRRGRPASAGPIPATPGRPKKPAAQSTSPWLNKPRDGFSSAMGARAQEMSNTREGLKVKGYPVDTPIPRALR
jgi:hypothetical protein